MRTVISLGVAAAIALSLPACRNEEAAAETPRQALERLAPSLEGAPPSPVAAPGAYRIVYERIAATARRTSDGRLVPERVERQVTRPFVSAVKGQLQRRLGFDRDAPTSRERAVFLRPLPDEPRPDVYPLPAGRDGGRDRRVAGRTCRVFLDGDDEYCVDGSGLVLASRVGTTVEVARKVDVVGGPASPDEIAATLATSVSDKNVGSVRPMQPDSSPPGRTDWSLPAPPDGFSFVGRYASVPLTGEVLAQGSQSIVAGIVDVYVRGIDAIVVDRGGKLDLGRITDKQIGVLAAPRPVDLGALGEGRVGIGGVGPFGYREVRAFPEAGRYVVVAGTLPADQLVGIARALRPLPGTTLRYLDE